MEDGNLVDKLVKKIVNNSTIKRMIIKGGNKYYLNKYTNGIGNLIEEKDRFVCYVNPKKIKKDRNGHSELYLGAFNSRIEDMKKIYRVYKIDKPIYYIIEGVNFVNCLYLTTFGEAYVIFKNCEFNKNIILNSVNSVTFEENKYYDHSPIYFGNSKTFLKGCANEVRFISDKFYNSDEECHPCRFGMNIDATKVEIIDSNINIDNTVEWGGKKVNSDSGAVEIKAKEIIINSSIINAPMVCLSCDSINIDKDSLVKSKSLVMIDNSKDDLENFNIESPCFSYNGIEFNDDKKIKLGKEDIKTQKERTNLINVMRAVLNEGLKSNEKEVEEIKNDIQRRPLKRVLKRENR